MNEPDLVGIDKCFVEDHPFAFDPDKVCAIPIDPVTGLTPDLGGDASRAVKRVVCARHMAMVNEQRRNRGENEWPVFPDSTTDWL